MIKPDWNVFKAKFSDNPQFHFEWFCYLLFCMEFKQQFGINRYKNQSAIETSPIECDGVILGFQSKFYDTTLSSNKTELIKTLVKAKRDYPELTKLYIYSNQEWTQSFSKNNNPKGRAKKTAAQTEIENKAKELNLQLEWRMSSYFESPFVTQTCQDISKHFFNTGKSLFDLIKAQETHTQSILKSVKPTMLYNGQQISLEREEFQAALKNQSASISIVCGKGGVGKTVEVKKLLQDKETSQLFFAFKATEFELKNLNELLDGIAVSEFLTLFEDGNSKVLIIDSAEKLIDLDNQEPFKEFIDLAVESKWRIIFTTRDHYFDDLNHLCMDILQVVPQKLYIAELTENELENLASKYVFQLPQDARLKELLRLPIYLNAFLKFYGGTSGKALNLPQFKHYLWNQIIKRGNIRRENVFSEVALRRANEGKFYTPLSGTDIEVAKLLVHDEVLGVHGSSFFISHDIYEEWALEKYIDLAFKNKISVKEFFETIGLALPIRRSFRFWLSEQLHTSKAEITVFIEKALDEDTLPSVWKDELLAATLLSDYSYSFFENFKRELLNADLILLKRVCFLLRIACKEMDNSFIKLLGLNQDGQWYFTKPKGKGWDSFVGFLSNNIEEIGFENLAMFVPVLFEWNSSVKKGDTTKKASLLCLNYYQWNEPKYSYSRDDKLVDSVLKTIAYGAEEIKSELNHFIEEVCKAKKEKGTRYFDNFAKLILKEFDGLYIAKTLPNKVFEIAEAYWLKEHDTRDPYMGYKEREHIFGVADEFDFNYHPESAYQTPIFNLLKLDLKGTIDFILNFINKITDNLTAHYSNIEFPTYKLNIDEDENEIILDHQLWGAYRGAGGAPDLVKSVLMALEKFFLELPKDTKPEVLESWLKYMLKNTNSSAICGVVASIVLANRDKLFNIAMYLFEVREFFDFDTSRIVFDSHYKGQLEMLGTMFGDLNHNKAYQTERLESCDASHRTESLENLCLYYQLFALAGKVGEQGVELRQNKIWSLLDSFYTEVESSEDSESLKIWRMYLARMDRRKMKITTENMGDKVALNFKPELTPDLKEMSDNQQTKQEQDFRYTPLLGWSRNKLDKQDDCKKHEYSRLNAITDLRNLIETLTNVVNPPSDNFVLFNRATHIYASAALLKFHFEDLSDEDKSLCLRVIEDCYKLLFSENYRYQISDGLEACFSVLPDLFHHLPELRPMLKMVLIAGLMRTDSINIHGSQRFSILAITAIVHLWKKYEHDVRTIYMGYLLLNPLYIELFDKVRRESFDNKEFNVSYEGLWQRLFDENQPILLAIEAGDIVDKYPIDYPTLDLHTKYVALYLLPNDSTSWSRVAFLKLLEVSASSLLTDDDDRSKDFFSRKEFFKKSAFYILSSEVSDIKVLLQPFINHFQSSEGSAELLEEFVLTQDSLAAYYQFWEVWELFRPKMVDLVQNQYLHYRFEKLVKSYLCAIPWWKAETKNWHTFKEREARFFGDMADKLSRSPTTLYSIAKILNDIGSEFLPYGVHWLAKIFINNKKLLTEDLDNDTVFYVNKYMRKYLYRERANVRRSPELMSKTLTVLDFLIYKGEVSGYLMRESIV